MDYGVCSRLVIPHVHARIVESHNEVLPESCFAEMLSSESEHYFQGYNVLV